MLCIISSPSELLADPWTAPAELGYCVFLLISFNSAEVDYDGRAENRYLVWGHRWTCPEREMIGYRATRLVSGTDFGS